MRPNDTLLIVGNGLDVSLGLPTTYADFMNSSDFQPVRLTPLGKHLAQIRTLQNWVDIEKELGRYCQQLYQPTPMGAGDSQRQLAKLKQDYTLLRTQLTDYLKRTASAFNPTAQRGSFAVSLITDLCNTQSSPLEVITFNYTDTLEQMDKAGLFPKALHVHHVHGSLGTGIVFGVEDKAELRPQEVYLYKSYSPDKQLEAFHDLLPYYKRVVFFGYSLGDTDKQYFQPYFERLSQDGTILRQFCIYHYGAPAYDTVNWQLQDFTGHNLTGLEVNHKVAFPDSAQPYRKPMFQ